MSCRLLPLALLLVPVAGCATDTVLAGPAAGYSYAPPQQLPHPAIAEGKPTVEYNGFTFYACPRWR